MYNWDVNYTHKTYELSYKVVDYKRLLETIKISSNHMSDCIQCAFTHSLWIYFGWKQYSVPSRPMQIIINTYLLTKMLLNE